MTRTLNSKDNKANSTKSTKFLYSYGGKILPRRTDGKLRYVGGHTRVLAVNRSISFAELMVRFGESCGSSMSLKCKLPSEDLDVLVTITCDEDLVTVIDEYNRFSLSTQTDLKITAVLFPLKSVKKISPTPSTVSSLNLSSAKSPSYFTELRSKNSSPAMGFPVVVREVGGKVRYYRCCEQENPSRHYYFVPYQNQYC